MKKARFMLFAVALLLFLFTGDAQEAKVIVPPVGLLEIGEEAFAGDASIEAVVIPGGVVISDDAFSGCVNLKTLIILDGTDVSFDSAFSSLPIEYVYCPVGSIAETYYRNKGICVYPVSDYAADSEFLTEIHPSGIVITGYAGADCDVSIPEFICGIPVVSIGDKAFYGNETIVTVSVPDSVTSIGQYAFYGLRSLESISLPKGIAEIGSYAFQNARNLKQIALNENLRALGENPFLNCAMLTTVTGLEENPGFAFSDGMIINLKDSSVVSYLSNTQAGEVIIPKGIVSIGKYAFSYAQALSCITLPETAEEICDFAFYECPSLRTVETEGVIKRIGASAFRNCERLSEIIFREGLTHIGDYAFKNCRSLPEIALPQSVRTVGKDIFYLDKPVSGSVLSIVPLYQFHYTKTVCVIGGEEKSVKTSGCGATCVAMVLRFMKEDYEVTPQTVFDWAYETGYYKGDGLSHLALSRYLSISGVQSRWTGSTTDVLDALKAGKPVIAHMGPGTFADNGHYILLRGIDENGLILVNDPNSRRLTQEAFSIQTIKSQLKTADGFCIIK